MPPTKPGDRLQQIGGILAPKIKEPSPDTSSYPPSAAICNTKPLTSTSDYTSSDIPEYPQCTPQPLRIIYVGAGAGGILFAHKAERMLENYSLVCYEKNAEIGGTWYENRYPGCACDIPAHTYVFPFEPNPDWSGYFSYSGEIQDYLQKCADKWQVHKYFELGREVVSARWLEGEAKYEVLIRKVGKDGNGQTFTDTCDVLVNGSGILNKWKWPDIPDRLEFQGKMVHSARWDPDLDWTGKKVAVIGSGSSSIQMLPHLAATAASVSVFLRNPTWVGPQIGTSIKNESADPNAMNPAAAGKHKYTDVEKTRFKTDPDFFLKYRTTIERAVVSAFPMFFRGGKLNAVAKDHMTADMKTKLGNDPELISRIIPDFSPGCRRLTPGEDYLETFSKPHVRAVFDSITRFTPEGILTADDTIHQFDIIACATGFDVQYAPRLRITGPNGDVLGEERSLNIYASVSVPNFPNYFLLNGPRGNWGQGCIMPSHECQIEYILQMCQRKQQDNIASFAPKQHLTDQLNNYMDAWHAKHSVWAEDCRSWYKKVGDDGKERVFIWPGSLLHLMKFLKRPRFEHYDIVYRDEENVFGFLGNGFTIGEERNGPNVPVAYIRNDEDQGWEIE